MCGISGIHSVSRAVGGADISCMNSAISHRGPDDEGYALYSRGAGVNFFRGDDSATNDGPHVSGVVAVPGNLLLGHRRLSIIDLSVAGHQPMSYDGSLTMVFNGELYNYRELRKELEAKGLAFKTNTDTEVALAAYRAWGEDCLSRFNGMWAFVVLDERRNALFGARDRFGVKPFYYFYDGSTFAFASEIKALLALPFVPRQVNDQALYSYLVWGATDRNAETFFKGIRRLEHSHSFEYDLAGASLAIKRYYSLKYSQELGSFSEGANASYIEGVKKRLFDSVRLRLRADVPIGSCLSGGVDSSAIAGVAANLLGGNGAQKVFTACYADSTVDESAYAGMVVERTGAEWHRVYPQADEFLRDLSALVYHQDEPFNSPSIYAQYRVMALAKGAGVKVLLDGQGADELFTGYKPFHAAFFLELLRNMRLSDASRELRCLGNSPVTAKELFVNVAKYLGGGVLPIAAVKAAKAYFSPENKFIRPALLRNRGDEEAREISRMSINAMCMRVIDKGHLQALLRYEDRNSMAYGIEARTPFADDLPLIEYAFSIPSIFKIRDGWSKALLRSSVKGIVPDAILRRTDKMGFATPERAWLKAMSAELRRLFDREDDYIDARAIHRGFDALLSEASTGGITRLWRYVNYILWRDCFGVRS